MIGLTDITEVVIAAADKRGALSKAHVSAGGSICPVCSALLVGKDICSHHLLDTVDPVAASEISARLTAVIHFACDRLGVERPR